MFSSKELISFVFANENDTYYGDDLLKRNLNQYLWEQLHESYDAVYFLSADGSNFRVRSFGDRNCSEYTPGKKKRHGWFNNSSEQLEMGSWMLRQLRAKPEATAAFVCSLDDFCSVLSDPRWNPVLDDIVEEKKRTGIFVLTAPATAERSANLLLTSPVFEKLHETAVTDLRGGVLRELYSTLKKRKWDNCVFLNTFSWERVHALLLHLVMEYPERCQSCEQLDQMTDYLYTYLRNPEFACTEKLFREEALAGYFMYEELFDWLKNERHWKKFETQSAQFITSGRSRIRQEFTSADVAILRDPNSYAGRCLKIKLPDWLKTDSEAQEQAQSVLYSIHSHVSVPKNRVENEALITIAEDLLNRLDGVRDGDSDSYQWVLSTLKFCISQIHAPPEQEKTGRIFEILKKRQDALAVFEQHFALQKNQLLTQGISAASKLQSVTLQQMKTEISALEKIKKRYIDLISAMELELEMPVKTNNFSNILDDLKLEIERFEQKLGAVPAEEPILEPEPEQEQTPNPEPKIEIEEDFILTPDLYNFIPPTH